MSDHNTPGWYQRLSHAGKDAVDQALHFLMGLGIASVGTAAAAWALFHWREFYQQAPIQRVYDTERDMRWGLIGACVGQIVNAVALGAIVWAVA